MTNNDVLRRVRYALRINDKAMLEIFKLGGMQVTLEELVGLLSKPEDEAFKNCNNKTLDAFLTGLITYKRGPQKPTPGAKPAEEVSNSAKNLNNLILRKLKIALAFRSEDMIDAFKTGGVNMSESELSAIFRRPDHKNYREAGDKYVRVFIKGITELFRGER
ncbi:MULTISPECIES: DUF1456 family protein [unclassified Cetobacterium]|uniref:DUF1456 family protein n=1 Tax=unclassified Cetobacterium TaxID=2630983 RepID=UPI00163C72D6|nr:DUF1456 family protein [Cetobacterium sp. 8H]MBC2850069.1 DUF1456 family protein [Cetobacterium sp. 8H]